MDGSDKIGVAMLTAGGCVLPTYIQFLLFPSLIVCSECRHIYGRLFKPNNVLSNCVTKLPHLRPLSNRNIAFERVNLIRYGSLLQPTTTTTLLVLACLLALFLLATVCMRNISDRNR